MSWIKSLWFWYRRRDKIPYSVITDKSGNLLFEGSVDKANLYVETHCFPGQILIHTTTWRDK